MISAQLLLIILFTGLLAGIMLYFFRKNREIELGHTQKTHSIKQAILLHKIQINYRNKGLLGYNFIKYNLDESLKIQPDIKLI